MLRWKDINLYGKMAIGFGSLLVLLVGIWGFFLVVVNKAEEGVAGNRIRNEMVRKELDHLKWANAVSTLLTDTHVNELTVQTDPHKCGFGKWYYGEERKSAEALLPELAPVLAQMEEPHRKLHETAIAIGDVYQIADLNLPNFLVEKEVDHLLWSRKLEGLFASGHLEGTLQTDDHLCGFGKFLYGPKGQEMASKNPKYAQLLKSIQSPHAHLHASATKILQLWKSDKEAGIATGLEAARQVFLNETEPALDETLSILKEMQQIAQADVEGLEKASAIYTSETMPLLAQVQSLLGQVGDIANQHLITDTQLLGSIHDYRIWVIIIGGIALPLGLGLAYIIARGIVGPIRKASEVLNQIERGHISDVRLNMQAKDEVGQMSSALDRLSDSLQYEVIKPLELLTQGDLRFDVTPRDNEDVLRGSLHKLGHDLNSLITEIQVSGDQIATGSSQVSDSSQTMSQGATEQASSVEEIASALTEVASQAQNTAQNAKQAQNLAGEASTMAEQGNAKMDAMTTAMGEINRAAQNVRTIIKTIDEIAFQTNLLALNAAVEAARAGQHGKGFAVVAEEVRSLAGRSAKAASETAELIENALTKATNGDRLAQETAKSLGQIVASVVKVNDLVTEIAAASNEQASGVDQVNVGLGQIDQVTQQNTAVAEECAAAAEELSGQSLQMRSMLQRFHIRASDKQPVSKQPMSLAEPDSDGWGNLAPATNPQKEFPASQIALDDEEFGRY